MLRETLDRLSKEIENTLGNSCCKEILTREYTLSCGTKIKDVIDLKNNTIDRYVLPIMPVEYIKLDFVVTKDGAKLK